MRSDEHFTGQIRFRIERRWFKPDALVVQMEFRFEDGPPDHHGLPMYLRGSYWRDAQVEDLGVLVSRMTQGGE